MLTLAALTKIHQTLEERQHQDTTDHDHADLGESRMKDDYDKIVKLVEWFKSTDLIQTDSQKLVSFATGEICTDNKVNCHMASEVGTEMQQSLDGQTFVSKVPLKSKCQNFTILRKTVKVNQKSVILAPYVLFQRLSIGAERNLKLKESL